MKKTLKLMMIVLLMQACDEGSKSDSYDLKSGWLLQVIVEPGIDEGLFETDTGMEVIDLCTSASGELDPDPGSAIPVVVPGCEYTSDFKEMNEGDGFALEVELSRIGDSSAAEVECARLEEGEEDDMLGKVLVCRAIVFNENGYTTQLKCKAMELNADNTVGERTTGRCDGLTSYGS